MAVASGVGFIAWTGHHRAAYAADDDDEDDGGDDDSAKSKDDDSDTETEDEDEDDKDQAAVTTGPEIGQAIPAFSMSDQAGTVQTLKSVMGPKGALLVFYRSADW